MDRRRLRSLISGIAAIAVCHLGASSAFADNHEGDGAAHSTASSGTAFHAIPYAARPLQLPAGVGNVEGTLGFPSGPDEMGDTGIGNFIGLDIGGNYGVTDQIQAGGRIRTALISPDQAEFFGALEVYGLYNFWHTANQWLSAGAGLGFGFPPSIGQAQYGAPIYFDFDGMRFGVAPELRYKGVFSGGQLGVTSQLRLPFVLNGTVDSSGEEESFDTLQWLFGVQYALTQALTLGGTTGLNSGDGYSFDSDEGLRVPFIAQINYQGIPNLDLGGEVGLASIVTRDGEDIGDTLVINLRARFFF